jgi:hypothetical protein
MRMFVLLIAAAALTPGIAAAANVSGAWKLDVNIGGQAVAVACNLIQSGPTVSGTCNRTDEPDTSAKADGGVDGSSVKFGYSVSFNGQSLRLAYSGKLSSDTSMSGAVETAGIAGTFTGTRQ